MKTRLSSVRFIQLLGFGLACASVGSARASTTLTLTSIVAQSNAMYSTTTSATGAPGLNGATGANDPAPLTASGTPFSFTSQNYASLSSIQSISITLTIYDGDTGAGDFDAGQLTLGLYQGALPALGTGAAVTNTGIVLNGFGAEDEPTLTFTTTDPTVASAVLTALKTNGTLGGAILDATGAANSNGMTLSSDFTTTLTIIGTSAVPEPGSLALVTGGAGLLGSWVLRRRAAAR